ncbi:MAG TPA: antitoxin Xre-like helix-turn-helix domain-containing protein [Alphaproteobacteria bacterium]|nr:antitoxin Xre-like helix-turn-helix domain-containing protein [Alphaproteobacteria bacterium]
MAGDAFASSTAPREGAPDLLDPAVRARLSGGGFRVFLSICDELGLSVPERRRLLGDVSEATYHNWRSKGPPALSVDQLERISLVLGIYKDLKLLFTDFATSLRWLRAANADLPFAGSSPQATMLRGSIDHLYKVRRYLDAWRGGRP